MQLAIGEVLEKAAAHQPCHVLPVVVALVGQLLLQHRAHRNHGGEGITKKQELQEKFSTQRPQQGGQQDGDHAT